MCFTASNLSNQPLRIAGEDDGYLLVFLHDEEENKSYFAIYDAKTMSSNALATVHLPQRVPYGFHGTFFSEAQIQAHAARYADI